MKHYVLKYIAPEQLMILLKIFIYSGVCYNGYGFITDDFNAAAALLNENSAFSDYANIFAVTMDTLAWIALLILFELETYFLDDSTLRLKRIKWPINALTSLCYFFIVYAFIGYLGKLGMLMDSIPYTLGNPCDLVGTSYVITPILDEYYPIAAEACGNLIPAQMGQINGHPIVFENSAYTDTMILAWVDVINSATWLAIVGMLQMDIIMQLKGTLNRHIMRMTAMIKGALYLTLFIMAIVWGVYGSFADFSDAVLWLLGFMLIELNIFNWNQEVEEEKAQQQQAAAS